MLALLSALAIPILGGATAYVCATAWADFCAWGADRGSEADDDTRGTW